MPEFFALLAIAILIFMGWRLYQAKQYNKFIDWLKNTVKPEACAKLNAHLKESRSELTPNTEAHLNATERYYQQYPIRIFQLAMQLGIIEPQWLESKKNKRFVAHLFAIQGQYKVTPIQYIGDEDSNDENSKDENECTVVKKKPS